MSVRFLIYLVLLVTVSAIGAVRYKRLTVPFKVLAWLAFAILISEIATRICVYYVRNSNPPYHVLVMVQYAGYATFYARIARQHSGKWIRLSIPAFAIFSLFNSAFSEGLWQYPSNALALSCVLLIIQALLLFIQMLKHPVPQALIHQSSFWLNSGILIYSASILCCFGILNYLINHQLDPEPVLHATYYLNFAYYLLYGYVLLTDKISSGNASFN
jgi:hypothetical protein